MSHLAFISHSSNDASFAEAICDALETQGIACWLAPRNVPPGLQYAEAIVEAISACRILIVVFSAHSNSSSQVAREVERAGSRGTPILTVLLEHVRMAPALEYFLSQHHWLDATTPPFEGHLQHLGAIVKRAVQITNSSQMAMYDASASDSSEVARPSPNLNAPIEALYRLRIESGPHAGQVYTLCNTRVVVGRSRDADVPIPKERCASRFHFAVNWDSHWQTYRFDVPATLNAISVNGKRLGTGIECGGGSPLLSPGDVIRVGSTIIVFEEIPDSAGEGIT